MGKLQRMVCRVCLEKCVDIKTVNDYLKNVLDVLMMKINLTVSVEPVTCANCTAMMMRCFEFKTTCFYTHDYIVPFLDDEKISKLDLRTVYMSKHNDVAIPDDHSVCGFCMGLAKKCMALALDNKEKDVMLDKLIEKRFPELDFSTIEEPMICALCYESLKTCFHFVTSCLIVEEKIMEYRELTGADVIEIADVLRWTSRNVEDGNSIDFIKIEEKVCVDMGNADERVGHENGNFVQMDEQKLLLNEDVEIKTDQYDFDGCLGDVVSQQPVTIKLRGKQECSESKGDPLKTSRKHKLTDSVSEARTYQCDSCTFRTKHLRSLQRHRRLHKNPKEIEMYQCNSCHFKTKHRGSLDAHKLVHKDASETEMYQCDSCHFKTRYKSSLNYHRLIHKDASEIEIYQCDSCHFKTKRKQNLIGHMLIHKDPSKVTMHQCDICSFQTKHKKSLRDHMATHKLSTNTTVYQCESCSYKTKDKRNLRDHKITHKLNSKTNMYQCASCSFRTKNKQCLQKHMITHKLPSEIEMYQCDSCHFKTKYKGSLYKHRLIHKDATEIEMHQCDSCHFKTKHKQYLKVHMLTHKDLSKRTMCMDL